MSRRTDQYYSICSQVFAALGYSHYPNNEWLDTGGPEYKWNPIKTRWLSGADAPPPTHTHTSASSNRSSYFMPL